MNLQINSLSKEYLDHQVLVDVNFSINSGDQIGLIGANGSGKTTLLRLLAGVETQDGGQIIRSPKNLKIGYVPQVTDFPFSKNITECLAESLGIDENEIYKINIALDKLNINDLALKPIDKLSSGQKTKVYLARLLIQNPDILLLDEPTNHLDIESLEWLENYLKNYQRSFLVISHDRKFLDNTVTKILELDNGQIKIYGGNYSFYRRQKIIEFESQKRNYIVQEKNIERTLDRVRVMKNQTQQLEVITSGADHYKRRKASKAASRAKSTEKMLTKQLSEKRVEKPKEDFELSVLLKPKRESNKLVVFLDKISKKFGDSQIISNFSLEINKGDRVALIGANGSGKSTLINLILNKLSLTEGSIDLGNNVDIGYLPQEHNQLNSDLSPVNYLIDVTKIDKTAAYKLAKRFLFTDEDIKTPINRLSSGQKSKILLASIMASGSNFIVLDEPTNYLDIPSREALEEALISYKGTLLVVSHDRYFLDRINLTKIVNLDQFSSI